MDRNYNLISVIKTLLKWKWHIAIVSIIGAISSILVSIFILKPYFQSYAIVYPTNQSMTDRSALFSFEGNNTTGESTYYGTKHDANRILTIANSSILINYVIKNYQLTKHYGFENTRYQGSKTYEKFLINYAVYKTDKDAIRINLIDTDKDLAAKIVNDIVATIAYETSKPIKENKQKISATFAKKLVEKQSELALKHAELDKLTAESTAYALAKTDYDALHTEYSDLKKLSEQYQIAAQQEMPGIEIIEQAYPAERKIKPVRSKIVIVSSLFIFFFACLGALLIEEIQWIRKQL
jgi:uncharacterized protein involved in exopolysaccharide biosynthesis